jgi:SAM-dependent methyltransferase
MLGFLMDAYVPSTYGDRIADVYDEWHRELAPDDAVDFLAALAGSGAALELGIGSGRVALPLARRGVEVHGIDASERMLGALRAKPEGDAIPITVGDFADVAVERRFALVYVVFNTFFALLSQDDQVRCFRNVAERLEAGGAFVIEAFVPDTSRFDRGQRTDAVDVGADEVRLTASIHDPLAQRVDSSHIVLRNDGQRLFPVRIRYAYPPELDLMARLAGLRIRERYEDWRRSTFGPTSQNHISVYERPAASTGELPQGSGGS